MNKIYLALFVIAGVFAFAEAASLGDAVLTVFTDSGVVVPGTEVDSVRAKREEDGFELRGLHHHHGHQKPQIHHHHHHHHHQTEVEEYHSKPTVCHKCGGGGGGSGATFATASAGSISNNGGGWHGNQGFGGQSVSQAAAYNFGPFSASFSASQSNPGFNGFF